MPPVSLLATLLATVLSFVLGGGYHTIKFVLIGPSFAVDSQVKGEKAKVKGRFEVNSQGRV